MPATDPMLIDVPERVQTERLLICRPQRGDGRIVAEAIRESIDDLRPWVAWARADTSDAESESTVRRMRGHFAMRADLPFFVFEREPDGGRGGFVGGIGLHRMDWSVPRFEIGYWRRSGHAGRGLITEAVRALGRMAFDALSAQRVEIRMDRRNGASARVAERAGFAFEALLRRDTVAIDGAVRDTLVYARVRGVEEAELPPLRDDAEVVDQAQGAGDASGARPQQTQHPASAQDVQAPSKSD